MKLSIREQKALEYLVDEYGIGVEKYGCVDINSIPPEFLGPHNDRHWKQGTILLLELADKGLIKIKENIFMKKFLPKCNVCLTFDGEYELNNE